MAEYIDRDELLKELCTVSAPTPSESWIVEKCIEKVNEQHTADVVPKSEVEELIKLVDDMLDLVCAMTGLELTYFGKYAELKKKYTE